MSYEFDVFLSFKNLDSAGTPTRDSQLAHELYDFLSAKGLSVFQSNIVLEELGETAFKKTIDGALDAAQILVAIGTSAANLESKWVRYEWDSFFTEILDGIKPAGKVFTYIQGMKINALPRSLRQTQTIIHNDTSKQKLYNFVANALKSNKPKSKFNWADIGIYGQIDTQQDQQDKPFKLLYKSPGDNVDTSMDLNKKIEEIKQDPGLSTEDKNFLVCMNEVAALDQQREKLMDKLIELDKRSDPNVATMRKAVFSTLELLNKIREKKMVEAKKTQEESTRTLQNLFKKP